MSLRKHAESLSARYKKSTSHGNAGPISIFASNTDGSKEACSSEDAPAKATSPTDDPGQKAATDLLAKNPLISASTFVNLLKSKGLKIVKAQESRKRYRESAMKCAMESFAKRYASIKKPTKEADSAGANNASMRAGVHSVESMAIRTQFLESAARDNGIGYQKFRVVLIQEGLGNLSDAYFYSSDALKSAVSVFEGKKLYADHPSRTEESDRPERSVRDVLGYFENVEYKESDGAGRLEADVHVLPDESFRWARTLLTHSVEFAKKYPDKEFVGLSINASGEADPVKISTLLENMALTNQMRLKIQKAIDSGVDVVKVVKVIKDAISCDLVTEAGAGGKILELIENQKNIHKGDAHV